MKVLVFAPHNDDEILGVGGTIAKYIKNGNDVYVCEVTSDKENIFMTNKIREEAKKAHKFLGIKETIFLDIDVVGIKDTKTIEVNKKFDDVVNMIKPEVAFIPHKGDMHIDHLEVSRAAMVALRPINNPQLEEIYAYETLSETEWNIPSVDNIFIPNVYVDISDFIDIKIKAMKFYETQVKMFPHPRSLEAIEHLSKVRGSTIGVRNAESFMLIRRKF